MIFAIAVIFVNREINSTDKLNIQDSPLPTSEEKEISEVDKVSYDEFFLNVAEMKVGNIASVDLIPNFEEELRANQIAKNHTCANIVNAGFYTEDRKPIGLFVSKNDTLSGYQNNNTLNGVISIGETGNVAITYSEPSSPRLAVQSGPVIVFDGVVTKLKLQRDFYARRIVAAIDTDNNLYFFAVYNPESSIQGPNLVDLGEIIKDYSERNGIEIASAINLDGGAASAFFSDSVTLEELVPVGSIFCLD